MSRSSVAIASPSLNRPGRELPKFEREVINRLIDQGWVYKFNPATNHGKLVPPDPTKRICTVASTPSDQKGRLLWFQHLRASGADLSEEHHAPREKRTTSTKLAPAPVIKGEGLSMRRRKKNAQEQLSVWHKPATPDVEIVLRRRAPGEPTPLPCRVVQLRPPRPCVPVDAKSTEYSLAVARSMVRRGYHIDRVITRTGWGRYWLDDVLPVGETRLAA